MPETPAETLARTSRNEDLAYATWQRMRAAGKPEADVLQVWSEYLTLVRERQDAQRATGMDLVELAWGLAAVGDEVQQMARECPLHGDGELRGRCSACDAEQAQYIREVRRG